MVSMRPLRRHRDASLGFHPLSLDLDTETMLGNLRIILADGHPLFALGSETLIAKCGIGTVVLSVRDTDMLVPLLRETPCDILVTDFAMPGRRYGDGLKLLAYLKRHFPNLPVAVQTMVNSPGVLRSIWTSGVSALLSKSGLPDELPLAIQAAVCGRRYLGSSIRPSVEDSRGRIEVAGARLSIRETEVLRLFGEGLSADDIAGRLQRSVKTVSRHKRSSMAKLGVATDGELFRYLSVLETVDQG
ncbi:response regulator [Burkholderia stabilis]|uniref:Response regulator n=2 Tax=Burkholderia stabilis TaxID=95485 RepID=A0A4Q2A6Q0_9BURK|nr:response regulator [Burkholderia stabilis]